MTKNSPSANAPNGWSNNWISQGQVYGTYGPGVAPYIQDTLIGSKNNPNDKGFNNGAYGGGGLDVTNPDHNASIDALMTYFGSGYAADNRTHILSRSDLTGVKSPWLVSNDINLNFIPVFVIYTNDASTDNNSFNIAIDTDSTGGTSNGLPMPVNVLINTAISSGAFLGARIKAAMKADDIDPSKADLTEAQINQLSTNRSANGIVGDLLFTPDGFGSFVENYQATDQSFAPASSPSWKGVKQVVQDPKQGNGWIIQFSDPSNPDVILPETVRGLTVKVNLTGDTAQALVTINQQDVPLPALKANQTYPFQSHLSQALDYLNNNKQALQAAGVVFPEVDLGKLKSDLDASGTARGFAPTAGGPILPDLKFSGNFDDYLAVQAYLIKLFAGPLNVSTVLNAWMGGNLQQSIGKAWYADTSSLREDSPMLSDANDPTEITARLTSLATQIRDKSATLGWFKASPYLDYLAIDKYGDDELADNSNIAQKITFNRNAWINYFQFTKLLAANLTTGPTASFKPGLGEPTGNTRTLLFQLPAAALAIADQNGEADIDNYYKYAMNSSGAAPGTLPFLSNVTDTLFGNTNLASKEVFTKNFPALASKQILIPGTTTGTIRLDDYLFSTKANALENSSNHDLTKGLLQNSGSKPIINDLLSHVFAIIWSSGTESAPINYRDTMWGSAGLGADPSNTNKGYKPNAWNTSVLSDVLEKIRVFKLTNSQLANFTNSQEITPRTVRLQNAWLQVDESKFKKSAFNYQSPGKIKSASDWHSQPAAVPVKLRIIDQNPEAVKIGFYRLDSSKGSQDLVTGSVQGSKPEAADYRNRVMQAVAHQWITEPEAWLMRKSNYKDITLPLLAGERYGLALLNDNDLLTSFAAANPHGEKHGALLPTGQLMRELAGIPSLSTNAHAAKTFGFEQSINNSDWDYNDISITPLSGATLIS